MNWKTKSLFFRLLSAVPYGAELHYLAQRRVTRQWPRPPEILDALASVAEGHTRNFREFSAAPIAEATFLEIGAGRDLAVALALRMLGAERVICADLNRLAKIDLVNFAARHMAERYGQQPVSFDSFAALERYGISYAAPQDVATMDGIEGAVDCFVSNEVLEHVPENSLRRILAAAKDFLKDDGLMLHTIDYSDHYARSDPAISRFNFLTFGEAEWKRHNSDFQYVNRLRHSDYMRLFSEFGFVTLKEEPYSTELPDSVRNGLSGQFRGYDIADLQIQRAALVLRNGAATA